MSAAIPQTRQAAPRRPGPRGANPGLDSLSAESQRMDQLTNAEFEKQAADLQQPTGYRPALVTADEVAQMRARYTTGQGRLDVLRKTANYREAYWTESIGQQPFDRITDEQREKAKAFFDANGTRLATTPRQAPPNPIKEREALAAAESKPPVPETKPVPAELPAPVRPVIPPHASLAIRFLSAAGFECTLTVHGVTGADALQQGRGVMKQLAEAGAKPLPADAAPVPAAGGAANDGPKVCKHHGPMKESRAPGVWFCPKKTPAGYCSMKWSAEKGYFESE